MSLSLGIYIPLCGLAAFTLHCPSCWQHHLANSQSSLSRVPAVAVGRLGVSQWHVFTRCKHVTCAYNPHSAGIWGRMGTRWELCQSASRNRFEWETVKNIDEVKGSRGRHLKSLWEIQLRDGVFALNVSDPRFITLQSVCACVHMCWNYLTNVWL